MGYWILQQPVWWIPLGIMITALLVWWLYGRSKTFPRPYRLLMASLRSAAILIVLLLLFNPMLRKTDVRLERPSILIGVDASSSVSSQADSLSRKENIGRILDQLKTELAGDYELDVYHFGERSRRISNGDVLPAFSDLQTDISDFLNQASLHYEGRNLKGMFMISDGLYNKGKNPLYEMSDLPAPLYAIGVGDSSLKKDLKIKSLRTNSLVYEGNRFPVEIDVQAFKVGSADLRLDILSDGKIVFSKSFRSEGQKAQQTIEAVLESGKAGNKKFIARLNRLEGEVSYANNQTSFYIDVLNGQQKILLLASQPGPDVSAFKRAIERSSNYQTELRLGATANWKAEEKHDLIILYGIGSDKKHLDWVKQWNEKGQNWLGILNVQSSQNAFNSLKSGVSIGGINNSYNESAAVEGKGFTYFELDRELLARLSRMPPILVPYGNYTTEDPNGSLLVQRIGSVNTQYPLIYLQSKEQMRNGVILGEGIWRWQLHEYDEFGDHAFTDHLVGKIIQFLTLKSDRRPFRLSPLKRRFAENEVVIFSAEAYNKNFEAINSPEVRMEMFDADGKKYEFQFSRKGEAYELNAGLLPPSVYRYKATAVVAGVKQTVEGEIVVNQLDVEQIETTANFGLLRAMAAKSGGAFALGEDISSQIALLNEAGKKTTLSYQTVRFRDLINFKWLLFLFSLFIAADWALRRWLGSY